MPEGVRRVTEPRKEERGEKAAHSKCVCAWLYIFGCTGYGPRRFSFLILGLSVGRTPLLTSLFCRGVDVVARLGLYLVSNPEPAFMPILKSLFTATTIPDTLVVILLDWKKPWDWMRQLRTWVRLLGALFRSLDDDARRALDEVTQTCRFSRRQRKNERL